MGLVHLELSCEQSAPRDSGRKVPYVVAEDPDPRCDFSKRAFRPQNGDPRLVASIQAKCLTSSASAVCESDVLVTTGFYTQD
ncbi:hypothetical protein BaRGS_00012910 [Batillaria attramentaria]|uniref:Uncharacterized protein n=1 Tax=Batillaria attramentaria TaxID=370345 RepID=A0ABD0L9A2_9CAEN